MARFSDTFSNFVDSLDISNVLEKIIMINDPKEDIGEEGKLDISDSKIEFLMDSKSDRPPLKIIHFNDVYNIEEQKEEPVAGYSRFYSALRSYDHLDPLILFSGDIFAPSKLSIFFEGEHMMPFLKKAGIHCACVGNHDFDFGDEKLGELINRTDFPWLLSNVKCAKTGKQFSNTVEQVVLSHGGYKIALIGIAESEWIESVNTLDIEDMDFESPVDCAKRYVKYFKHEQKDIDFLIALTHMRTARDDILAKEVPELDLILGGHDHHRVNHQFYGTLMKKSGTDFRELTVINLCHSNSTEQELSDLEHKIKPESAEFTNCYKTRKSVKGTIIKDLSKFDQSHKTLVTEFEVVEITSQFPSDKELDDSVYEFIKDIDKKMKVLIGYTGVELDLLFTQVRHDETNMSNMLADMVNHVNKTD